MCPIVKFKLSPDELKSVGAITLVAVPTFLVHQGLVELFGDISTMYPVVDGGLLLTFQLSLTDVKLVVGQVEAIGAGGVTTGGGGGGGAMGGGGGGGNIVTVVPQVNEPLAAWLE